jgi:IS5 family transposase
MVLGLAGLIDQYIALTQKVINQTERRVMRGEKVPASEKVVSIFEPHTDIIVKDQRDTLFGHKVCLARWGFQLNPGLLGLGRKPGR